MSEMSYGDFHEDVDLASSVQQLLFPKSSPLCSWCCIGVKNRMARGLGGDYFDFITMPDDCQMLLVGDVTGHGLSASVVMALIYGFMHRAALESCAPQQTACGINRFLRSFARRSRRLDHYFSSTLFYAVIEPETRQMSYLNCGQVPPLIRRGSELFRLHATGPPLGFFDDPDLVPGQFQFQRGDRLLIYTDGIVEATNRAGHQFGDRGVAELLLDADGDHLEFLEQLFERMAAFGASDPPADDCTAIVIDFHGSFWQTDQQSAPSPA
jgi:serine phosphatase RsbU (regulator of sigma subunit)